MHHHLRRPAATCQALPCARHDLQSHAARCPHNWMISSTGRRSNLQTSLVRSFPRQPSVHHVHRDTSPARHWMWELHPGIPYFTPRCDGCGESASTCPPVRHLHAVSAHLNLLKRANTLHAKHTESTMAILRHDPNVSQSLSASLCVCSPSFSLASFRFVWLRVVTCCTVWSPMSACSHTSSRVLLSHFPPSFAWEHVNGTWLATHRHMDRTLCASCAPMPASLCDRCMYAIVRKLACLHRLAHAALCSICLIPFTSENTIPEKGQYSPWDKVSIRECCNACFPLRNAPPVMSDVGINRWE